MPLDTRPGTSTASTISSPPGISGIVPTARAAAQATVRPPTEGCARGVRAKPRHPTSANRLISDQLKAVARSRRLRLTDSSWHSISRHLASPTSAGLPRNALNRASTRQPIPSISSGRDATAWASSSSATKPPRVNSSENGLFLAPRKNAPPSPNSANPTACSTPDITSCQDATNVDAPQIRCCRSRNVAASTGPPGSVVLSAVGRVVSGLGP